jgi:CheY-like chemotaxis protein
MLTRPAARRPTGEALPSSRRHRRPERQEGHARQPHNHEPHPAAGKASPSARSGSLPRVLAGLQILLVDDDPDIIELFTAVLSACGGDVVAADNASDGLALAIQTRPHVIVSDIAMTGEDGYWLVGRLRRLPADMRPNVPVLAATAYGREHSRNRVLAAGFTEHVQKPVDPEDLCRLVAKLAGR